MTVRRIVPQEVKDARRWFDWRPQKQFYVAGQSDKTTESGVWDSVIAAIAKHKGPDAKRGVARRPRP